MIENWVTVPGYDKYEASESGLIRRVSTGELAFQRDNGRESLVVNMYRNGGTTTKQVRRIIANTFLRHQLPGIREDITNLIVRHLDTDYRNCSAENLVWDTRLNVQWRINNPVNLTRGVMIEETQQAFENVIECAKYLQTSEVPIDKCLYDRELTFKGYHYSWIWR